MESFEAVLAAEFLGNTGRQWLNAAGVALFFLAVFFIVKPFVRARFAALAEKTETRWDDLFVELIAGTKGVAMITFAAFFGSLALALPEKARTIIVSVTLIALILQAGLWASRVLQFYIKQTIDRRQKRDPGSIAALNVTGWIGRLVVWSVVLLLVLENMGIDITALVAGLGVGGIAVALAVQNVLGDLFASLSIVLDKPFVVGDFLILDDYMGSVEHVGLKTTRLRSLSGEQLVLSNADLLASRIRNYGRMSERRALFTLGVTYQTPREKLKRIPEIIRESIEANEKTRFDRSHFKAYGAYSLDFETVYYVLEPDYALYMDIQQAINLAIHERFETEGIDFAFPTQTLFVEGGAAAQPAG
jgi:small-conductance mechanosensitive channel